ncbi:hypothetical protein NIASO_16620 [Niabella soli DSM 19437]|uniref:Uncharacterized protein n=1 Tax=Niabella soli DSM 19437 TaxID=929713 RepID=W0F7Y1_9BACT|nr:hypothetical protein NIASO_16620 [Niabella soli DSM 19437]
MKRKISGRRVSGKTGLEINHYICRQNKYR